MYRVRITEPAEDDIRAAYEWWRNNRSAEQAAKWYLGIRDAIASLRQMPDRCEIAPESHLLPERMRQLLYGIGPRPTHRIVFAIRAQEVAVLRVRHASQDALRPDDISGDPR